MKKGSAAWVKRDEELKVRALAILATMQDFRMKAYNTVKRIETFLYKYPEKILDSLEWEVRERLLAELDGFYKELKDHEIILKKLDEDYNKLRKEVNEFYGKVVMGEVTPLKPLFPAELSEPEDPADWWKREQH